MFGARACSHIKEKTSKLMPNFGNNNASPSIQRIRLIGRAVASFHHATPDTIFRQFVPYPCTSMFVVEKGTSFFQPTPTTGGVPTAQMGCPYRHLITTDTLAYPILG